MGVKVDPATDLFLILVTGAIMALIAMVSWRAAKACIRFFNPDINDAEAGFSIGSLLISVAYALYPASLVLLATWSPWATGATFIAACVILHRMMFRNG